jgi:L-lactate dehydrogenase complex protein LldG
MTPQGGAREEILGRVRAALPGAPASVAASYASITRRYEKKGALGREACLELFIDRLVDYDSQVVPLRGASEIAGAVARVLQEAGEDRLIVADAMPREWCPAGVELIVDEGLTDEQVDRAQAVLTTCEVAIASTGTIVLVHGGAQGRRIASLLPDHHICIVRREQVLELVPEAFRLLAAQGAKPITTISGPSATADIEMTRIRGVHGPRRLSVLLYG